MLENRVTALEEKVGRIDAALQRIEPKIAEMIGELRQLPKATDYASLKADLAEVRGRLSNTPTTMQLFAFTITTWAAGAAIVFAIMRFAG